MMTMMVLSAGFFTGAALAAEPAEGMVQQQTGNGDAGFSKGFDAMNAGLAATTRVVRCGAGGIDDEVCSLLGNRRLDVSDRSEALATRLASLGGNADGWLVPVVQPLTRCAPVMVPEIDRDGDMIGFEATGETSCKQVGTTVATFWVGDAGAVLYRGVKHVGPNAEDRALASLVPAVR
jgi:hypothetical protein